MKQYSNVLYVFYFFSGATALVYEIVWARRLGLIFGADVYGVATVLSVFFLGLAIGSYVFGRLIDKENFQSISNLQLYGFLELAIGLYAAATPLVFKLIEAVQISFPRSFTPSYSGFSILTFFLSLSGLLIPTVLMGATFPAISKVVVHNKRHIGRRIAFLYAINTIGALVGSLLSGFFFISYLGLNLTTFFTAFVNLSIGFLAVFGRFQQEKEESPLLFLSRKERLKKMREFYNEDNQLLRKRDRRFLLFIFFLTGFSALALEVLWTRVLILSFGASTYAFTTILAIFLFGIGLGSFMGSFFKKQKGLFSFLLLSLGVVVVGVTPFLGDIPSFMIGFLDASHSSYLELLGFSFLISFAMLLLPTVLMGMIFALGLKLYTRTHDSVSQDTGVLYSINTMGGVFGAYAAGFILLPLAGIQRGIIIVSTAYLISAVIALLYFMEGKRVLKSLAVLLVCLVVIIGFLLPSWNKHLLTSGVFAYYRDYLEDKSTPFEEKVSRGDILYYKEGLLATVVVERAPEGFLFLRTNGKTDASTDQDLDDLHLIGHLPMLLHPHASSVLVIGMGSGITLSSVAAYNAKSIDVVEIEPAMFEAAAFFKQYNHDVIHDQRVKLITEDVRGYLVRSDKRYDVITSQPSNLWVKGNASLFTKEFFQRARQRLNDNGLILQWVPYYGLSSSDFKSILNTFASVFPYVSVWSPVVSQDVLLIGSKHQQMYDFTNVKQHLASEKVQEDLSSAAITSGEVLLAHYRFDEQGIKKIVGNTMLHTDDKPILEFSSPFSLNQDTILENLRIITSVLGNVRDHFSNLYRADQSALEKAQQAVNLILSAKIKSGSDKLEEAASNFKKALDIMPKEQTKKELARVYFELAKRSNEVGDTAKTVENFQKSVEAYPTAQVYLNLSILYLQQNRLAAASESLERAKSLEPHNLRIKEIEKAINKQK